MNQQKYTLLYILKYRDPSDGHEGDQHVIKESKHDDNLSWSDEVKQWADENETPVKITPIQTKLF
jgi:hypothetical protein